MSGLPQATFPDVRELVVPFPTEEEVIEAILREANDKLVACSRSTAQGLYKMLEWAVATSRVRRGSDGRMPHFGLTDRQHRDFHDVLEVIMIDGDDDPAEDSAHNIINRHFLRFWDGERCIVHTKTGRNNEYCALAYRVMTD